MQGQSAATISGTVKDPTGATVAGAIVTLVDGKTSSKLQVPTGEAGQYVFSGLTPGNYTVQVAAPGFSAFEKPVSVAAEPVKVDIALILAQETSQVSVEAKIDPYNVVPTQPTDRIFGLDQKLEEIPRSISTADQETLLRYNVKTVNDIVTVSSGTYTGSYFGIPGSLFLRGDIGDNFFRGFRRVENRGNYETPVDATDHIEIVKGPPRRLTAAAASADSSTSFPRPPAAKAQNGWRNRQARLHLPTAVTTKSAAASNSGLPFKMGTPSQRRSTFFSRSRTYTAFTKAWRTGTSWARSPSTPKSRPRSGSRTDSRDSMTRGRKI